MKNYNKVILHFQNQLLNKQDLYDRFLKHSLVCMIDQSKLDDEMLMLTDECIEDYNEVEKIELSDDDGKEIHRELKLEFHKFINKEDGKKFMLEQMKQLGLHFEYGLLQVA